MTEHAFPSGEGELAQWIRTKDWSATPLGPIGEWPIGLRMAVELTLSSPVATVLLWGPSLIQVYNDHWRDLMGCKHPLALGQSTHECFPEIAAIMAPLYERVLRGESVLLQDKLLPIRRTDEIEDAWWNVYYVPIRNELSQVTGILCTVIETTRAVLAERARADAVAALLANEERHEFLLQLSDAIRPLTDPIQVQQVAVRLLVEHLSLMRGMYVEFDADQDSFKCTARYERIPGPIPKMRRVSDISPEIAKAFSNRQTVVFCDTDVEARDESERETYRSLGVRAWIAVPLVKDERLIAVLAIHSATTRAWTENETRTVEDVAERTWSAVERARAEQSVRLGEQRLQRFGVASSDGLWIRDAVTLALVYASPAMEDIYGVTLQKLREEPRLWAGLILPEDRDDALACLKRVREGEAVVHEFRIQRPSDRSFRCIRSTGFPLLDDAGNVQEVAGISADITPMKLATEHQDILLGELQHRVRNVIAVIRVIASRMACSARSIKDYASALDDRLLTFARVQALLTRSANTGISLKAIITDELHGQLLDDAQLDLSGPDMLLAPKTVEALTLVIHELATNALKYGALATPNGSVQMHWRIADHNGVPWIVLDWKERGGQVLLPDGPRRRGLGSELIERRIPYELGGRSSLCITTEGAQCQLSFPLKSGASILETGAPVPTGVYGGDLAMSASGDLQGQRVLVLEDDYFLAYDTARALRSAGAEVAGPCTSEDEAHRVLHFTAATAAVLDIDLDGVHCFQTARGLAAQRIPFVFVTGCDHDVIPSDLGDVPRLQKPVMLKDVVNTLSARIASVG